METGYQTTVTLTMDQHWHDELQKQFAEAKQEYPALTMDQFIAWATRYYLEHAYKPEQLKGDPNCGQCHGAGCAQCNDTLYYQEEETAQQQRRDQEVDFARRIHDVGR